MYTTKETDPEGKRGSGSETEVDRLRRCNIFQGLFIMVET